MVKGCPGSRSVSGAMSEASLPLTARSHRATRAYFTIEFATHGVGR